MMNAMKERQRWQPEEDTLLREYVRQYGAKEWGLVSERMGRPLHRDPKSCHERWKNYLRPGLKKGSLTPDEQALVISLQSRYGNKWKAIAAHLPGRTPKRLGKWWEVFKEKQHKKSLAMAPPPQMAPEQQAFNLLNSQAAAAAAAVAATSSSTSPTAANAVAASPSISSTYDHILQTFAEKHILMSPTLMPDCSSSCSSTMTTAVSPPTPPPPPPSVTLSLSPPRSPSVPIHQVPALAQLCGEVEEARRAWTRHRKEVSWRLNRLEQQMETEKARKKREKSEEVEFMIRKLREEGRAWVERLEAEWREKAAEARRVAEDEEAAAASHFLGKKQAKLSALVAKLAINDGGGGGGGEGRGGGVMGAKSCENLERLYI